MGTILSLGFDPRIEDLQGRFTCGRIDPMSNPLDVVITGGAPAGNAASKLVKSP